MKKITKYFRNHEQITVLIALFLIELVAIGINIPRLGFYHDDWYLLWSGSTRGAESIVAMFSTDRPFMGVIYSYTYRLFGDSLLSWHIFAFLLRLLGGYGFYALLKEIFPNQTGLNFFMTAVFYIYPGFLSQPDANTKQNHLLGYGLAIYSLYFSVVAVKIRNIWIKGLAAILSGILALNYFFIYEYMIGLEAARIIFMLIAVYRDPEGDLKQGIRSAIKIWIPSAVAATLFLYWRFFIFESVRSATDVSKLTSGYFDNLQAMSYRLVFQSLRDFLDTTVFAWFVKPYSLIRSADNTDLFVGIAMAFAIGIIVLRLMEIGSERSNKPDPRLLIISGMAITLAALFPVVLSNREFDPTDAYKSYGLHPTMGVALIVGGLYAQIRKQYGKLFVLVIFLIGITTQYLNGIVWADLWNLQTNTYWQLTWRAPDLEDGTVLVIRMPDGSKFRENYEVWGPINLIYRPGASDTPIIAAEVINPKIFVDALQKTNGGTKTRDILIPQDFSKLLVLDRSNEDACLTIMDQGLPIYPEVITADVAELIPYSVGAMIVSNHEQTDPPLGIFGPEPPKTWCYYYQKASLAYQLGDWDKVVEYYEIVINQNLEPVVAEEWIPFIGGLANSGNMIEAEKAYNKYFKNLDRFEIMTCRAFEDPNAPLDIARVENLRKIMCE